MSENNNYPGFDKRRKEYKAKIKDAIEERKETTRNRVLGGYCLLAIFVFCLILAVIWYIRVYGFTNVGI